MNKVFSIGLGLLIVTLFQNCKNQKEAIMENNRVTWFSIPTDSLNRAAKFYNSAFNWKIQPLTVEEDDNFSFNIMLNSESDNNYVSNKKGAVNGCLVKRKIGLPTPAVLVEVDNIIIIAETINMAINFFIYYSITFKIPTF